MSKVTSKYQVTVPKTIADSYHIRPGDEIEWVPAGEVIRVIPPGRAVQTEGVESRLRLFDQATDRLRQRSFMAAAGQGKDGGDRGIVDQGIVDRGARGWTREDLYGRGRSD